MNGNEKIIYGILGGLGAGILLGMLFAPEKGSVTRNKIVDKVTDLSNQIKSTATAAVDKIHQVGSNARNTYEQVKEDTNS
jgi:gas vesicle protein